MPATHHRDTAPSSWIETRAPAFTRVLTTGLPTPSTTALPVRVVGGDWPILLEEVRTHRLQGLLVHAVTNGDVLLDDDHRSEVAELERELTGRRMWHERESVTLISLLAEAGIEVRVLKGPALQSVDYPDPQMRPTGDLDLLVHGRDIDAACAVLASVGGARTDPDPIAGYTARVGKGATIAMESGLEVDLHRLLVWGSFGVQMPPEDLWRASRSFTLAGLPVETLAVEETLLHAAYHLLIQGWRRALSLRDVIQVAWSSDLSTDRLLHLANRWQATAVLAAAVDLSFHATSAAVPPTDLVEWATAYRPSIRDRALLRIQRPEAPIGSLDAIVTYLALQPAERAVLRDATLHPRADTWPSPSQRAKRVVARAQRRRS